MSDLLRLSYAAQFIQQFLTAQVEFQIDRVGELGQTCELGPRSSWKTKKGVRAQVSGKVFAKFLAQRQAKLRAVTAKHAQLRAVLQGAISSPIF